MSTGNVRHVYLDNVPIMLFIMEFAIKLSAVRLHCNHRIHLIV